MVAPAAIVTSAATIASVVAPVACALRVADESAEICAYPRESIAVEPSAPPAFNARAGSAERDGLEERLEGPFFRPRSKIDRADEPRVDEAQPQLRPTDAVVEEGRELESGRAVGGAMRAAEERECRERANRERRERREIGGDGDVAVGRPRDDHAAIVVSRGYDEVRAHIRVRESRRGPRVQRRALLREKRPLERGRPVRREAEVDCGRIGRPVRDADEGDGERRRLGVGGDVSVVASSAASSVDASAAGGSAGFVSSPAHPIAARLAQIVANRAGCIARRSSTAAARPARGVSRGRSQVAEASSHRLA